MQLKKFASINFLSQYCCITVLPDARMYLLIDQKVVCEASLPELNYLFLTQLDYE